MTEFHELKEKPGDCVACGTSPVNHVVTKFFNTLNVWAGALFKNISTSYIYKKIDRIIAYIHYYVGPISNRFAWVLGIVRYKDDPTKAVSYRSQVVWEDGASLGIVTHQITIYGKLTELYRSRIPQGFMYPNAPERTVVYESLPVPPWVSGTGNSWFDDKYTLKQFLRSHGVPAPRSITCTTESEAVDAFRELGAPVVCKPRIGSRARHTTVYITTEDELKAAFKSAKMLNRFVCVEEHLVGPVCRATVIGGNLVGFFEGAPPRIVGDGVHTVRELIDIKNATKHERVQKVVCTDEHIRFLAKQQMMLDSVLPSDKSVWLTWRTGRMFGGETRELLTTVHPKMRSYMEKAAAVLDTPVVGFDLIIADPESDPDTQIWGVIEANSMPFVDIHYLPLKGTPSRAALSVWQLWKRV